MAKLLSIADDYIQNSRGKKFHFWRGDASEVEVADVARGLAQTSRWRGMYKDAIDFYSVAQHCVIASEIAPAYAKRYALFHDAAEWPLGDMPKPIKDQLPDYKKLEGFILATILRRFRIEPSARVLGAVKIIDNYMLHQEAHQLLVDPAVLLERELSMGRPPMHCPWAPDRLRLRSWSPREAQERFLQQFERLFNVRSGTRSRECQAGKSHHRGLQRPEGAARQSEQGGGRSQNSARNVQRTLAPAA